MRIYMDNAATTPLRPDVIAAMAESLQLHSGNPSSIHADGRLVRAAIESARKAVASRLKASIGEIFFTSGGTESSNMAIKCSVRDLGVSRIVSAPTEHHCVLHSLESVGREGVEIAMLAVDGRGRVDYGELESLLSSGEGKKTLVSLMHANNEIGTLHDLAHISALCQQHGALFHSDTVQTIGHLPIDLSQTRIDFLTGGAHKFHGPKGCGFIYVNGDNRIKPWIDGGSQERNMRGGTENVAGIVGMARALDLACEHLEEYRAHIEDVRSYFIRRLTEDFEDIRFNGDYDGQYLYTILSVSFPPSPTSDLMLLQLDIEGVSASGGSACTSGSEAGSHVLQAIGAAEGRKSIRFSFSHYNTREEVDLVVEKLGKWVKKRG